MDTRPFCYYTHVYNLLSRTFSQEKQMLGRGTTIYWYLFVHRNAVITVLRAIISFRLLSFLFDIRQLCMYCKLLNT